MPKDGLDEIYDFVAKLKRNRIPLEEAEERLKAFYDRKGYDRGITLYSAEYKGRSDANNYRCMFNHGYDRVRFHAYRKGFYSEMLFSLIHPDYLSNKEYTQDEISKYLRSFKVPTSNIYINNYCCPIKIGID